MTEPMYIIKASGAREAWDPLKLERSLRAARADDKLIREIINHVEHDLTDGMRTRDIYAHAFELLRRYNRPIAAEYSLKQAIMQLGPSGYPFERFIAHILNAEGYRTEVGVTVRGACVPHEVDVTAIKEDERILVEAKYHNSNDIRSDVKVALYVHARFQDIQKQIEGSVAGIGFFTRAWLITNTNFTSQAIQYAKCVDLALTGWNYPKGATLQDLIQKTQTHPITCLTSLTAAHKRTLLDNGIVLCRDVLRDESLFNKLGLSRGRAAVVKQEGEALCPVVPN